MANIDDVPRYDALMQPLVGQLRAHGGSMTIDEMEDAVALAIGLSEEVRGVTHGKWQEAAYASRLGWARSYLKGAGLLENSKRGVWSLTTAGAATTTLDIALVKRASAQASAAKKKAASPSGVPDSEPVIAGSDEQGGQEAGAWKAQLLQHLIGLHPAAFERLCQRLLREAGFIKVEVTGKSGDGGIDGTGVLRMNLLSFQVIFQCKRWQSSVGASTVRDFRGAMVGRADKGLILTTATFTAEARREAVRDGAPAIDLVDGDTLCDLLKEHRIGVTVEMVESVSVRPELLAAI